MASILSYALTTLADVKETLGIDSGVTTKDNLIIRKINQATEMIERYCGLPRDHHFAETTYTQEEFNGTGTNVLVLRMWPVNSGETFTLQERGTSQNLDDWDTVDTENYHVNYKAGLVRGLFTFLKYPHLYRVTYTAGYSTIPADLAEAAVTLAGYLVDNATSGTSVKRKREGQREIEYHAPQSDDSLFKSLGIDDILNTYGLDPLQDAR